MRWAGQLLVIAGLLAAAVGAPSIALRVADSAEERTYEAERLLARAHQALARGAEARAAAIGYVLVGEDTLRAEYDQAASEALAALAALQAAGVADEEAAAAAAAFDRWRAEGPDVFLAMAEAGNGEGAAALAQSGRPAELFAAFARAGEELAARLAQEVEDRRAAQRQAAVGSFLLFGLGMVALTAVLAGAARLLTNLRRARRAERDARELARTASKLAEERRALLGAATNELRGPLTALGLAAEMLSREVERRGDEALAPLAQELARSVRRLTALVEDLLDYAALETGSLTLLREPADLRAIAEAAIADVRAVRSEVTPLIEVAGTEPRLAADVPRLRRAIAAIVGTLVRQGAPPHRVVIVGEGSAGVCIIEGPAPAGDAAVGPNISADVARKIIELHGGSVDELSPGSIAIRLPAAAGADPPRTGASEARA